MSNNHPLTDETCQDNKASWILEGVEFKRFELSPAAQQKIDALAEEFKRRSERNAAND